jgi:hypothetical protein
MSGPVTNQIGAADVGTDRISGQPASGAEARRPVQRLHSDDPVSKDRLLGVDIAQESVQRPSPLTQALGQGRPLLCADHPRHQVKRKKLSPALPADPEGDAFCTLLLLDAALFRAQRRHAEIG